MGTVEGLARLGQELEAGEFSSQVARLHQPPLMTSQQTLIFLSLLLSPLVSTTPFSYIQVSANTRLTLAFIVCIPRKEETERLNSRNTSSTWP